MMRHNACGYLAQRPVCVRPAPVRPECAVPCPPQPCQWLPAQPGRGGYLLPKIVASGREWRRRWQVCLNLTDLPGSAQPPFTLVSVTAAGEGCLWETVPQPVYSQLVLRVTVPLLCQVRDSAGCVYAGHAHVEVNVCLRTGIHGCDCWRTSMMLQHCARLVCLPCASDSGCFDALLEVLVEAYLVRWEACLPCAGKPNCPPDLPLYPQPRME